MEGLLIPAYYHASKSPLKDSKGMLRFFLNDQPFFFNGILDQGYWPDGLMTAPSDEALIYDIEKLKKIWF